MATLKRRRRRRGGGGPDGTAGASRVVDLSHQTLAKPETRRGSAETGGRAADAWRSGARRPGRHADREPKGASFRLLLLLLVLVLAIDMQQLQCEHHRQGKIRRMPITARKREQKNIRRRGKSGSAGGASTLPRTPKGYVSFGLFMPRKEKGAASTKLTAPL